MESASQYFVTSGIRVGMMSRIVLTFPSEVHCFIGRSWGFLAVQEQPFPFPGNACGQPKEWTGPLGQDSKSIEMCLNRVPVARYGLIFRQNDATASSLFFILVGEISDFIFDRFVVEMRFQGP